MLPKDLRGDRDVATLLMARLSVLIARRPSTMPSSPTPSVGASGSSARRVHDEASSSGALRIGPDMWAEPTHLVTFEFDQGGPTDGR